MDLVVIQDLRASRYTRLHVKENMFEQITLKKFPYSRTIFTVVALKIISDTKY